MTLHVSKHSNQPCNVLFVNFYNFLNNDVIMSSLVNTGNCKLGHDCRRVCCCVHTDDTTKLSPTSCEFVFTPPTPTRQTVSSRRRRRCVLGISYCQRKAHTAQLNQSWKRSNMTKSHITKKYQCTIGSGTMTRGGSGVRDPPAAVNCERAATAVPRPVEQR